MQIISWMIEVDEVLKEKKTYCWDNCQQHSNK